MAFLFPVLFLAASALPVGAAAGEIKTEGVTIRLIAEPPDDAGRVRGAVLFDLEPGWKTYWLDPGESGLVPSLDFSRSQGVGRPFVAFPAPRRLTAEGEALNGYDAPMAIAFETRGVADGRLVLSMLAGVCRTLCVPISATLDRDLSAPLAMEDAMAIDRAFLSLPDAGETVAGRIEGDVLLVEAPAGPQDTLDLFVAGPPGWRFGEPLGRDGALWRVPIRERPRDAHARSEPLQGIFIERRRALALTIDLP